MPIRSEPAKMMHEELRQRLKLDKRTKSEMLAAAVDLALDAKLLPTKACTDRKLPAGSHTRAKALAARIVSEGLLGLCTPTPDAQQQQPEALPASDHLHRLRFDLHVQEEWVRVRLSVLNPPADHCT